MFLGTSVFRGSNMIAGVFLARLLGKEVFGQYGIVQSSVLMMASFGALGLGITSTKHVAEWRATDPDRAGRIIGFCSLVAILSGCAMALAMYFSSSFLASKVLSAPELFNVLKISSLLLLFTAWQGAQNGSLTGIQAFRGMALVNIISGVLLITLTVIGAYAAGLIGAVWGWVCANIAQSLLNTYTLYNANKALGIKVRFRFGRDEAQLLWRFSLPAALGGLMFGPIVWAGHAILVNSPYGFIEMGRYNAGYQWFAILLFLPGIINNALFPIIAEHGGKKEIKGVKSSFKMGLKTSFIFLGPLTLAVIFLSPFIMRLYGRDFENDWLILVILACAAFVAGVQNLIGNTIAVMGRMWLYFKINLLWAGSFLVFAWVLVGVNLGATGLALATLLSYILRMLLGIIFVQRWLNS